jgi:ribosomal 50S subunit-recycling heat shock protein
MSRWISLLVAWLAIVSLSVSGARAAQETKSVAKSGKTEQASGDQIKRGNIIRARARVEAVDHKKRLVTIKGPWGNTVTLKVDEAVKNLPQVAVGDRVLVEYEESIAIRVMKPGEQAGPVTAETSLTTAKPGEKPAGVVRNQITVTATIEAIDKDKPSVVLKGPEGNLTEVKVQNPENLKKVKVGDQIEITYTEALAISVQKIDKN